MLVIVPVLVAVRMAVAVLMSALGGPAGQARHLPQERLGIGMVRH